MTRQRVLSISILTLFLLGSTGAAFGADFADVVIGSNQISFVTKNLSSGQLAVSGPNGFSFERKFAAGDALSFSIFNKAGFALPDGTYQWNLSMNAPAAEGDRAAYTPKGERVQSGVFTISGGAFVDSDLVEGGFTKDQVINDDLIVTSSICVGQDCNNGESFGFDTIRLKENNLRIKAQDTSNSASFPTNDWQITFNDSSNGGANKFSIDDIDGGRTPFTIEASTPTNSLYVDSSGRIGLGTNAPVADVHVKTGNTPTVRLEQDGSSGFTAQTWDLAGNEANFFIRDATNGSALALRIFPGSGTANALSIAADGNIGLGTTSPGQALDINQGSGGGNIRITGNNVGNILQDDTSGTQQFVNSDRFRLRGLDSSGAPSVDGVSMNLLTGVFGVNCTDGDTPVVGAEFVVGNGGSCNGATYSVIDAGTGISNSSSRTYKENLKVVEADGVLDKITNIDVYTYDFINDGPKDSLGLIAEDFHQIFERGSDKMISDREVQMAMWLAIQEMAAKIGTLEAELAAAQAD